MAAVPAGLALCAAAGRDQPRSLTHDTSSTWYGILPSRLRCCDGVRCLITPSALACHVMSLRWWHLRTPLPRVPEKSGNFCLFLEIPGFPRKFLEIFAFFWKFLEIFAFFWKFLPFFGNFWKFLPFLAFFPIFLNFLSITNFYERATASEVKISRVFVVAAVS